MKPALLVVDLQNEFFAEGSPALGSLRSAAEYVNAAIQLFRRAGAPVVVVSDIEEPDRVPGHEAFAVHASIAVEAGDLRVDKRHGNAFWKTALDEELRARSVDVVIVCGFCAEHCVLDTYRGARERGYASALLRGGLASPVGEHVRVVEAICEVVSYGALAGLMGLAVIARESGPRE
jgi:nicotinamidase-related amidase